MSSLAEMKARLKHLEEAIRETEARLPAHWVKPPVMQELFALEDEVDALKRQIRTLEEDRSEGRRM